jgi:uncharacterized sulfatase
MTPTLLRACRDLGTPAHFGVRSDRYKLIFFYGADFTGRSRGKNRQAFDGNRYHANTPAAWEFYDLQKDPHELVNEYHNPAYAAAIGELKSELKRQRQSLNETDAKYPRIQKIIDQHWND